jgi:hypothetical protein
MKTALPINVANAIESLFQGVIVFEIQSRNRLLEDKVLHGGHSGSGFSVPS